jgi:8-amino-7-oxononanoate synthase
MERINLALQRRKANGLFRSLNKTARSVQGKIYVENKEYFDFSSNDYLGLSGHRRLKDAAKDVTESLGTGSCGSRLLSGDSHIHHRLEEAVAAFKDKEAALIFNSGYQANLGIISALYDKDDVVFSDKLNHASLVDAIRLSRANFFRFRHNDLEHLEYLLIKQRGKFKRALIVTETVFSMDGDKSPLKEIVELKEKHNSWLMVDEAHATGIFGLNGSGLAEESGLGDKIELIMGTFSKALGSFGAYLATSKKIKDYLINFSRSFIYSTALPPGVVGANLAGLILVKEEAWRRKALLENRDFFYDSLLKHGLSPKGDSQIVPLILGEAKKVLKLSAQLKARGYWAPAIRPPTVANGQSRLRFSLSCSHPRHLLEKLANDLYELRDV